MAHGRARYLFLANSANEPVRVRVTGLPAAPIRVESLSEPGDTTIVRKGGIDVSLEALEVRAYRFESAAR